MNDKVLSTRDMDFLLWDWLDLEPMLETAASNGREVFDRETIEAYLELSQKLAVEKFLPHYKLSDQKEPYLDDEGVHVLPEIREALHEYGELGLFAASFPTGLGGMGLPYLVTSVSHAWFAAANGATSGYTMLTGANARLISTFGNEKQRETFALPQIEGRWFGTMCLSEPQAGSGLGDIKTKAVPDGEDAFGNRYKLTGNKMWISGGDQDISENIVHLVLAKIPTEDGTLPQGTSGISLFIVPKILDDGSKNDVVVAGLNHKMGNRGTSNCLLNFGESGGAIGWIVGEPGQGLRQMFMMMNEARIAVGLGAACLAVRGHLLATDYARERLQGRLVGQKEDAPVAIIEHPDVKRMLLATKSYAEASMALCLYCAKLVDQKSNPEANALLELLTPVAKTFPSEFGLEANKIALQVHGGYGYTRDFDVEQLYRDNRLNPIHEGTTGIQAADLLGRKLLHPKASGLEVLRERMAETMEAANRTSELASHAAALGAALTALHRTLTHLRTVEVGRQLDNAAPFLEAFGHIVVAWLWLDQTLAATKLNNQDEETRNFVEGKLAACRYFYEFELPKTGPLLKFVGEANDAVASTPSRVL